MGEGTLGYSWSWLANLSNLLAKDMIPNIKVACETLQVRIGWHCQHIDFLLSL